MDACDGVDCTSQGDTEATCVDESPPGVSFSCSCSGMYSFAQDSCKPVSVSSSSSAESAVFFSAASSANVFGMISGVMFFVCSTVELC